MRHGKGYAKKQKWHLVKVAKAARLDETSCRPTWLVYCFGLAIVDKDVDLNPQEPRLCVKEGNKNDFRCKPEWVGALESAR
jgi:hypothetical protein